ncbi:hypothetical protein C2845_PM12G12960 [Panicum miliaceum]|uniref:Uncharacterized protein n=1 Tax=Panicum miliaceum TaxID=4540 RepID=A0A3L6QJQ8_PANMI|nr:hypothetical protein C2845_PM12G12960 [Panicum miliaceum]
MADDDSTRRALLHHPRSVPAHDGLALLLLPTCGQGARAAARAPAVPGGPAPPCVRRLVRPPPPRRRLRPVAPPTRGQEGARGRPSAGRPRRGLPLPVRGGSCGRPNPPALLPTGARSRLGVPDRSACAAAPLCSWPRSSSTGACLHPCLKRPTSTASQLLKSDVQTGTATTISVPATSGHAEADAHKSPPATASSVVGAHGSHPGRCFVRPPPHMTYARCSPTAAESSACQSCQHA